MTPVPEARRDPQPILPLVRQSREYDRAIPANSLVWPRRDGRKTSLCTP
jgi:hypothetical protein